MRYLYFNVFRKVLPRKLRGFQEKKKKKNLGKIVDLFHVLGFK